MDKHETPDLSATGKAGGGLHNIKLYEVHFTPLSKVKTPIMRQTLMIAQKTKDYMDMIRNKYHVSFSTIVDVLFNCMKIDIKLGTNMFAKDIKTEYLDTSHFITTTIKINKENEKELTSCYTQNEIRKILSNLCYLFANNFEQMLASKQAIGNLKNIINNELSKKRETYWNYNTLYRSLVRARKQYGKDYENKTD